MPYCSSTRAQPDITWRSLSLPIKMATRVAALVTEPSASVQARERLLPDVLAILHAVERDAGHGFVHLLHGHVQAGAQCGDAQDPPADGDDLPVPAVGGGMVDDHVLGPLELLEPLD